MINEKAILQKLKSKAKRTGLPYQLILQLFCQEEFLRRLSLSGYKDQLVLKGGLFLFSYTGFESRPTMDIDFLAKNLSNSQEEMRRVVEEITSQQTEQDYVIFEVKSVENIAEVKAYHGVRLKLLAAIANTRTPFDIDIGIGDVIVPDVSNILMPTQLPDFAPLSLASYSLESTIAEKLEAMFDRMETTSRMKDYYDIYYLASNYNFDGKTVTEAIKKTFQKRETACNIESLEKIRVMYLNEDMRRRWNAFTRKSLGVMLEFQEVVEQIIEFVEGPIASIVKGEIFDKKWIKDDSVYIDKL